MVVGHQRSPSCRCSPTPAPSLLRPCSHPCSCACGRFHASDIGLPLRGACGSAFNPTVPLEQEHGHRRGPGVLLTSRLCVVRPGPRVRAFLLCARVRSSVPCPVVRMRFAPLLTCPVPRAVFIGPPRPPGSFRDCTAGVAGKMGVLPVIASGSSNTLRVFDCLRPVSRGAAPRIPPVPGSYSCHLDRR